MSATASTGGVRRARWRQRERMVGRTSSREGAHSSHTVRGAGSSTAFSSTLPAPSVSRSASSRTITCQRPSAGEAGRRRTRSRVSFTPRSSRSVRTHLRRRRAYRSGSCGSRRRTRSPGLPPSARSGLTHCSAAAKARAAVDRPEPGGPVNSQACVIFDASGGAACRRDGRDQRVGVPGGSGELLAHPLLSDQVVPYGHGRRPSVPSRIRRGIHCADPADPTDAQSPSVRCRTLRHPIAGAPLTVRPAHPSGRTGRTRRQIRRQPRGRRPPASSGPSSSS